MQFSCQRHLDIAHVSVFSLGLGSCIFYKAKKQRQSYVFYSLVIVL